MSTWNVRYSNVALIFMTSDPKLRDACFSGCDAERSFALRVFVTIYAVRADLSRALFDVRTSSSACASWLRIRQRAASFDPVQRARSVLRWVCRVCRVSMRVLTCLICASSKQQTVPQFCVGASLQCSSCRISVNPKSSARQWRMKVKRSACV